MTNQNKPENFAWYIPSVYGDIKLERLTDSSTRVNLVGVSPTEKEAVKALFKHALKPSIMAKPWATQDELASIDLASLKEQRFVLSAPLSKVQGFLQKTLKPHRKQVSAVRFTNGRLEEVSEALLQQIDAPPEATTVDNVVPIKKEEPAAAAPPPPPPKPERAVTVAQPVQGCPAPDFDDAEVRATRVLKAFLMPEQIEDFARRQQFIAIGGATGHRYLLTSRHSRHALAHVSMRCLYDMDEKHAFCVHDWEVPAAEELLGLLVHISVPHLEVYARRIPDREGVLA